MMLCNNLIIEASSKKGVKMLFSVMVPAINGFTEVVMVYLKLPSLQLQSLSCIFSVKNVKLIIRKKERTCLKESIATLVIEIALLKTKV